MINLDKEIEERPGLALILDAICVKSTQIYEQIQAKKKERQDEIDHLKKQIQSLIDFEKKNHPALKNINPEYEIGYLNYYLSGPLNDIGLKINYLESDLHDHYGIKELYRIYESGYIPVTQSQFCEFTKLSEPVVKALISHLMSKEVLLRKRSLFGYAYKITETYEENLSISS